MASGEVAFDFLAVLQKKHGANRQSAFGSSPLQAQTVWE
jgi:hypothetical protein